VTFAPTELDYRGIAGSASLIDSDSTTFVSGRLYVVAVSVSGSVGRTTTSITNNAGVSGTWAEALSGGTDSTWSDGVNWATTCFTSTNASGTGSIRANLSGSASSSLRIQIFEIPDGFDTSGMIVQSVIGFTALGGSAQSTANLANSAAAANMRLGYFVHRLTDAFTAANGGTLEGAHADTSPNSVTVGLWWKVGDATSDPSVTYADNSRTTGYWAIEIKAAAVTESFVPARDRLPITPPYSGYNLPARRPVAWLPEMTAVGVSTGARLRVAERARVAVGHAATSPARLRTPTRLRAGKVKDSTNAARLRLAVRAKATLSISPWKVSGRHLNLNGVETTVKGVSQYVGAGWGDDGLTNTFTGAALTTFVNDLVDCGINIVRLPMQDDTGSTYRAFVKGVIEACAAQNIYCVLNPQDGAPGTWAGNQWPTQSTTNDTAIAAANFLIAYWNYLPAADRKWVLFETINEPTLDWLVPSEVTAWKNGHIAAIDVLRAGGYDGPILCDGMNYSWTIPVEGEVLTILAHDPNVWFASHRYATPDGTTYLGDSDPTTDWKPAWPDVADSIGFAFVQGEWGPYNGGLGSGRTLDDNLDGWCTTMAAEITAARGLDDCAGMFGWIWVWSDENTMRSYDDWNDTQTVTPVRWGDMVCGMFTAVAVSVGARLRTSLKARALVAHGAPNETPRLRVAVRAKITPVHAGTGQAARLRTATRARTLVAKGASTSAPRLRIAERARALVAHAAPNEAGRLRAVEWTRVTSVKGAGTSAPRLRTATRARALVAKGASTSAPRLRVAERARAVVAHAATGTATRARVAERFLAGALHAAPNETTRLRGAVKIGAFGSQALNVMTGAFLRVAERARAADTHAAAGQATRLRTTVRLRDTSVKGASTAAPRLRVAERARAAGLHAVSDTARLRAVGDLRAGTAGAHASPSVLRISGRTRAVVAHAAPVAAPRLRAAVRARTAGVHAAPTVTPRLRLAVRARVAVAHAAPAQAARLRAAVKLRALGTQVGIAQTGARLRLAVRQRAQGAHAAPAETTRLRVASRTRAGSVKGALAAPRLRAAIRTRVTSVKGAGAQPRLRAAVRARSGARHDAATPGRLRIATRSRSVGYVKGSNPATRLRVSVRSYVLYSPGFGTRALLRVAARLRARVFQVPPGEVTCSSSTLEPARISSATLEPVNVTAGALVPAMTSACSLEECDA